MMLFRLAFVVLLLIAIGTVCRMAFARSSALGFVVTAAIAARAVIGFGLIAAAHLDAVRRAGLVSADGFWVLAPDARVYYALAVRVASHGPLSIGIGAPSPFFIIALGAWFWAAGTSAASVVLFNIACYVAIAALVLRLLSHSNGRPWNERAATLALVSFGFSPILLLTSAQALKDPVFALLIVLMSVSALRSFQLLRRPSLAIAPSLLACVTVMIFSMYGITGIRPYYGLFLCIAYGAGVVAVMGASDWPNLLRVGTSGLTILWVLWVAFTAGGGLYYQDLLARTIGFRIPTITWLVESQQPSAGRPPSTLDVGALAGSVESLREGFILSGGDTNLDDIHHWQSGSRLVRLVAGVGVGLSAMFVPVSVLKFLSIVTFHGGRGLLAFTDLDTMFLDLTLLAGVAVVYRYHLTQSLDLLNVIFVATAATVSVVLLAYVVTNFGTLFRLRLLATVPAWLVPLVLCTRSEKPEDQPSLIPGA